MKQSVLLTVLAAGTVFLTGCYTQLTTIDRTPPPQPKEEVEWVVDSATGDTVKVVRQVDTIQTEDHQTCIWERDLMGYPHLRCYDSFYPRDWFYYNNSPWWYRNDPYWYDYSRCPRYYYYDPSCGCCRYTADFYHTDRRHYDRDGIQYEKTEPSGPSGYRSRVRGVPNPGTAGPSKSSSRVSSGTSTQSSTGSADNKTIVVPEDENGKKTVIVNERRSGVPAAGTAAPVTSSPKTTVKKASSGSGNSSSQSSPSANPSTNSPRQQSHPANQNDERRPRRRNPRSW